MLQKQKVELQWLWKVQWFGHIIKAHKQKFSLAQTQNCLKMAIDSFLMCFRFSTLVRCVDSSCHTHGMVWFLNNVLTVFHTIPAVTLDSASQQHWKTFHCQTSWGCPLWTGHFGVWARTPWKSNKGDKQMNAKLFCFWWKRKPTDLRPSCCHIGEVSLVRGWCRRICQPRQADTSSLSRLMCG